ncbi:hypothetical protein EOM86_08680 [Candidatus Nomurabacteria bacterium]|nr:hypothetical protein [Candidatus Nomurabacteria bacterium]
MSIRFVHDEEHSLARWNGKGSIYTLSLILSALIPLTACSAQTTLTPDDNDSAGIISEETSDEYKYHDNLPELDFQGASYDMLVSDNPGWGDSIHLPEEYNGEPVNDIKIDIARAAEDRFNCAVTETVKPYEFVNDQMVNTIKAGDTTYDVMYLRDNEGDKFVREGLLLDYEDVPNIDLTSPWWDQKVLALSSINHHFYYACNAYDLTYYDRTHCMVFNKQMVEDYSLDSPYELVSSGKWTIFTMEELMKDIRKDVNGDGIFDDQDQWGYLSSSKELLANFWMGAGEQTVKKDSDDLLYYGLKGNERFISVIMKVFSVMWDEGSWCPSYKDAPTDIPAEGILIFTAGRGLFMDETIRDLMTLRSADLNFGILPYPKYEESQEEYHSRIEAAYKIACVPINNSDTELTGTLMEALACDACNRLIPAYYDTTLISKVTRDNESETMLEVIFGSLFFDYGDTWWCGDIRDGIFWNLFKNNNSNIVSKIEMIENIVNSNIERTIPSYSKDGE